MQEDDAFVSSAAAVMEDKSKEHEKLIRVVGDNGREEDNQRKGKSLDTFRKLDSAVNYNTTTTTIQENTKPLKPTIIQKRIISHTSKSDTQDRFTLQEPGNNTTTQYPITTGNIPSESLVAEEVNDIVENVKAAIEDVKADHINVATTEVLEQQTSTSYALDGSLSLNSEASIKTNHPINETTEKETIYINPAKDIYDATTGLPNSESDSLTKIANTEISEIASEAVRDITTTSPNLTNDTTQVLTESTEKSTVKTLATPNQNRTSFGVTTQASKNDETKTETAVETTTKLSFTRKIPFKNTVSKTRVNEQINYDEANESKHESVTGKNKFSGNGFRSAARKAKNETSHTAEISTKTRPTFNNRLKSPKEGKDVINSENNENNENNPLKNDRETETGTNNETSTINSEDDELVAAVQSTKIQSIKQPFPGLKRITSGTTEAELIEENYNFDTDEKENKSKKEEISTKFPSRKPFVSDSRVTTEQPTETTTVSSASETATTKASTVSTLELNDETSFRIEAPIFNLPSTNIPEMKATSFSAESLVEVTSPSTSESALKVMDHYANPSSETSPSLQETSSLTTENLSSESSSSMEETDSSTTATPITESSSFIREVEPSTTDTTSSEFSSSQKITNTETSSAAAEANTRRLIINKNNTRVETTLSQTETGEEEDEDETSTSSNSLNNPSSAEPIRKTLTITNRTRTTLTRPSTAQAPETLLREEITATKKSFSRNTSLTKTNSNTGLKDNKNRDNDVEIISEEPKVETVTRKSLLSANRVKTELYRSTPNEDDTEINENISVRKTIGIFQQRSLKNDQEPETEIEVPTRRPFPGLGRLARITTEADEKVTSTTPSLTRRKQEPKNEPDDEVKVYEVPTRRPFPGLGRLARFTTKTPSIIDETVSSATTYSIRPPLGSFKRQTTKSPIENGDHKDEDKENKSIKLPVPTRKSFINLNRFTTIDSSGEGERSSITTTGQQIETTTGESIRATPISVASTVPISENKVEQEIIHIREELKNGLSSETSLDRIEDVFQETIQSMMPLIEEDSLEATTQPVSTEQHRKVIKKIIRKPATERSQKNSNDNERNATDIALGVEISSNNSTTIEVVTSDNTRTEDVKTESSIPAQSTQDYFVSSRLMATTTEVPSLSEDSLESSREFATTTTRPARTTTSASDNTKDVDKFTTETTNTTPRAYSTVNRFKLSDQSSQTNSDKDDITLNGSVTKRTFTRLNRLGAGTASTPIDVDNKGANGKTASVDISSRNTMSSLSQQQRPTLKIHPSVDPISKQLEHETREVTTRRSLRSFGHRQQKDFSNSLLSTESRATLQPFNINRPQYQRPSPKPLGNHLVTDDDDVEYDEDEEEDEDDDDDDDDDEDDYDNDNENKETNTNQDKKHSNKLASPRLATKEPSSALYNLRNPVRFESNQEKDSHSPGIVNVRLKTPLTNRNKTLNTTTTVTTTTFTNTASLRKPSQTSNGYLKESEANDEDIVSSKTAHSATNPNSVQSSSSTDNSRYTSINLNRSSSSTVANYLNRVQIKTNTGPQSKTSHLNETDQVKHNNLNKYYDNNNDDEEDGYGDKNDESTEDKTEFSFKSEFKNSDKGANDVDNDDSKRRFQKYQFQRRTTTPLSIPSTTSITTSTTTTTTSTTTTEKPLNRLRDDEDDGANGVDGDGDGDDDDDDDEDDSIKANSQVNEKRATSTNLPEILAPTTTSTESSSSPSSASPLTRRVKVLRFRRPLNLNSNNNNQTITSSSATNSTNTVSTEALDSLSSVSEIVEHTIEAHTLTVTQNETPSVTTTPTPTAPKRFRKVVRKLIRPVNKTPKETTSANEEVSSTASTTSITTTEKVILAPSSVPLLQRRPNATRYGFNRSTKFSQSALKTNSVEEEENGKDEEEKEEEEHEVIKTTRIQNVPINKPGRAGSRFALPKGVGSTLTPSSSAPTRASLHSSTSRKYINKPVSPTTTSTTTTTTTEVPKSAEIESTEDEENSNEEEDEDEEEGDSEEEEEEETSTIVAVETSQPTTIPSTSTSTTTTSTTTTTTTTPAPTTIVPEIITTTTSVELETTTQLDDKANEANLKLLDLQKLRLKIRADLSKTDDKEGVLNDKLVLGKNAENLSEKDDPLLKLRNKVKEELTKSDDGENEGILSVKLLTGKTVENSVEKDDPLLKLRNKVKEDLTKVNQEEGVLHERLKVTTHSNEDSGQTDNPLHKLRNKVQHDLAKGSQEEGVVNTKLKKLLEHKQNDEVEGSGEGNELEKIRQKVKAQLAKGEQEEFVINNRLKQVLNQKSENTNTNTVEEDTTTEVYESSGDDELAKSITTRRAFFPRTKLTSIDDTENEQTTLLPTTSRTTTTTTPGPRGRPNLRKLVARRPFNLPTKLPSVSRTSTSAVKLPASNGKKKYEKRKFGQLHPLNSSNRNIGQGFVRKNPRGKLLAGTDRYRIEGSAVANGEEYDEYEDEEEVHVKPGRPKYTVPQRPPAANRPVIARPPLFNRPQLNILNKPKVVVSQDNGADDTVNEDDEDDDEEEYDDEDEEENEDEEEEAKEEGPAVGVNKPVVNVPGKNVVNKPTFKTKDNRVFPGSRPALSANGNRPTGNVPSRVANIPNAANNRGVGNKTASSPSNRFGTARGTNKPRVVNRPPGVVSPSLTIKPVAINFEVTTPLIPTKPAPFIPKNTLTYERKYAGPSTTEAGITDSDINSLIEEIDIEALNARNKKIFDINSKKHTTLKPKVHEPDTTQELQPEPRPDQSIQHKQEKQGEEQQTTTPQPELLTTFPPEQHEQEHPQIQLEVVVKEQKQEQEQVQVEVQPPQQREQEPLGVVQKQTTPQSEMVEEYTTTTPSPLNGFATTTPATPVDDTLLIGTIHNTDDQMNLNNQTLNVNAISPQDPEGSSNAVTTTQPPSTTLLHIFTLSDEENATINPLAENTPAVGPQIFAVGPDQMLIEVNRNVNSKPTENVPAVQGAPAYKVEASPTLDKFSEVNGVKYIHLVHGHDIKIDGRSSVTDYTPVEVTSARTSQPVRNSLPEGIDSEADRYGKALLPELLREVVETSTISLEGLFDTMRKSKVLKGVDEATTQQPEGVTEQIPESSTESSLRSSTKEEVKTSTTQEATSSTTQEVTHSTTQEVKTSTTLEVKSNTTPEVTSSKTPEVQTSTVSFTKERTFYPTTTEGYKTFSSYFSEQSHDSYEPLFVIRHEQKDPANKVEDNNASIQQQQQQQQGAINKEVKINEGLTTINIQQTIRQETESNENSAFDQSITANKESNVSAQQPIDFVVTSKEVPNSSESHVLPTLTTTERPLVAKVEIATESSQEREQQVTKKATTVAAALFPSYVRPIVPLLRPESNESSPLVISIANLDKVILSKVTQSEANTDDEQQQQSRQDQEQPQFTTIIPNLEDSEITTSTTSTTTTTTTEKPTTTTITSTTPPSTTYTTTTTTTTTSSPISYFLETHTERAPKSIESNGIFASSPDRLSSIALLDAVILGKTRQLQKLTLEKNISPPEIITAKSTISDPITNAILSYRHSQEAQTERSRSYPEIITAQSTVADSATNAIPPFYYSRHNTQREHTPPHTDLDDSDGAFSSRMITVVKSQSDETQSKSLGVTHFLTERDSRARQSSQNVITPTYYTLDGIPVQQAQLQSEIVTVNNIKTKPVTKVISTVNNNLHEPKQSEVVTIRNIVAHPVQNVIPTYFYGPREGRQQHYTDPLPPFYTYSNENSFHADPTTTTATPPFYYNNQNTETPYLQQTHHKASMSQVSQTEQGSSSVGSTTGSLGYGRQFNTVVQSPHGSESHVATVYPQNANMATHQYSTAASTHELRHPATVNINGLTVTRRPVLSVRKRLINSPVLATTTITTTTTTTPTTTATKTTNPLLFAAGETSTYQPNTATTLEQQQRQRQQQQQSAQTSVTPSDVGDGGEFTTTSKYNRLRTPQRLFYNSPALTTITTTPGTTLATFTKAGYKSKKQQRAENDLKVASSPSASAPASDNDIGGKPNTKYPPSSSSLRRKYQSRRLTTTTASSANGDDSGTDPPRTQNPLFKRRFSLTTVTPFTAKTLLPSTRVTTTIRPPTEAATTTPPYFEGLDNEEATDQVAKSSIHTSRFNQINGRPHIDEEDDEVDTGVVRHVAKSIQKSSTTRQPTSRYLHHQQQQIYHQTNYNLEDVITRRMDGSGAGPAVVKLTSTTTTTTRPVIKKRKMIVKQRPQQVTPTSAARPIVDSKRRALKYQDSFDRTNSYQKTKPGVVKSSQEPGRTYRPNIDYDYYDDEDARVVGNRKDQQLKVILHGGGLIECLDQGNFPHPLSCRKFISCAKFETGGVVGWEYTCPKGLSYDPVGGMCNWAAGLGCKE